MKRNEFLEIGKNAKTQKNAKFTGVFLSYYLSKLV